MCIIHVVIFSLSATSVSSRFDLYSLSLSHVFIFTLLQLSLQGMDLLIMIILQFKDKFKPFISTCKLYYL